MKLPVRTLLCSSGNKNMRLLILSIFVVSTFLGSSVRAQVESSMKWGQVAKDELNASQPPDHIKDEALVLGDVMEIYLDYIDEKPAYTYNRHLRIKLYSPESLERGVLNFQYEHFQETELPTSIKGVAIFPDGRHVKLDRSMIETKKVNRYFTKVTAAFPSLEPGVIVDFKYTIRSFHSRFTREFYLQSDLPALFREIYFEFPREISDYARIIRGAIPLKDYQEYYYSKTFELRNEIEEFGLVGFNYATGTNRSNGLNRTTTAYDILMTGLYYRVENVSSLKFEPLAEAYNSLCASISFYRDMYISDERWVAD